MHNSKLIHILKLLSKDEFKSFGKYLESPYHNSNKKLLVFFEILKKFHPSYEHPKLTKPWVYEKLYSKNKSFNDNQLRSIMSDMVKSVKKFLAHQEVQTDSALQQKLFTQSLSNRKHFKPFEKASEKASTLNELQAFRDANYFLELYQINRKLYFHPETTPFQKSRHRIQIIDHYLNAHFILSKLRLSLEFLARKRMFGEDNEIPFLNQILTISNKSRFGISLFGLYADLVKLHLEETSLDEFRKLRQSFESQIDLLPRDEQETVLRSLINFLTSKSTTWDKEAQRENFELYKLGLSHGLFTQRDMLPTNSFLNMITTAVYLKEWDWVERFMIEFESKLPYPDRKDTLHFSHAFYYFHQQEFSKVVEQLNQIRSTELIFTLRYKTLLIRAFYEISLIDESYGYEFLLAQIEAYEKFLKRNKRLPDNRRKPFLLFCFICKKLLEIRFRKNHTKTKKGNWLSLIENNDIINRKWLLEKLATL